MRSLITRLLSRALLYSFLVVIAATSHAQTGPKFVKRTESQVLPGSGVPVITIEGQDEGSITHNQSLAGNGLPSQTTANSSINDTVTLYVRADTPQAIPYRLDYSFIGSVSAATTGGGSCQGLAYWDNQNHGFDGNGEIVLENLTDPPAWLYQTPYNSNANSKSLSIEWIQSTSGTGSGANTFPEYPDSTYQQIFNYQRIAGERRKSQVFPPTCGVSTHVDAQMNFDISLDPLPDRIREPGRTPGFGEYGECGGDTKIQSFINYGSGNGIISIDDPVRTRGYPLTNRIHVNTQTVEFNRPMGNAAFTYDIHLTQQELPLEGGGTALHWVIVDADGQRLNFGLSPYTPSPGPGIYSTLTQPIQPTSFPQGFSASFLSVDSFILYAGPPERLRDAGNYRYYFNSEGKLTKLIDPAGNTQNLIYTAGKLTQVNDASSGKRLDYTYNGSLIDKVIENQSNIETRLSYTLGLLSRVEVFEGATPSFSASFTYDTDNRPLTLVRDDDSASTHTFSYNRVPSLEPNAFVDLTNVSTARGNSLIIYNLDPIGSGVSRTRVSNYKGGTYDYEFDALWDATDIKLPPVTGSVTPVSYQIAYTNRRATFVSDGSSDYTLEYKPNGVLKKITDELLNFWEYSYSGVNLTKVEDSLGVVTTIQYENSQRPNIPTGYTDALGQKWTIGINNFGQTTSISPPPGSPQGIRNFTYYTGSTNPFRGWPKDIVDALGNKVTFDDYSAIGDLEAVSSYIDPLNPLTQQTTEMEYDAAQRMTLYRHPDGKERISTYAGTRLDLTQDEAGKVTDYTWCPTCGALNEVDRPLGFELTWNRDFDEDVKDFFDTRDKKTSYVYGKAGELVSATFPDFSVESFSYDESARLRKYTNARGQERQYTYDTVGRLWKEEFLTTFEPTIETLYRADNRVDTISDAAGTRTYEYFGNRLLKAINYTYTGLTPVQRVEYTYWPDDSVNTVTWKSGGVTVATWTYDYDLAGRLESVTSFGDSVTYEYDGVDKLLTETRSNGTTTEYVYNDARGWPEHIYQKLSGNAFAEYHLTYDLGLNTVGNLTRVVELGGGEVNYGYDDLYRLTSEVRTGTGAYSNSFQYDLAGNLEQLNSTTFATYDDANKIASIPSGSIAHDLDGNITSVSGAGITLSALTWDTRNYATSQTTSGVTVSYGYDGDGKRVWSQLGTDPKKFYIFSGDNLIGEIENEVPTASYAWGTNGLISKRDLVAGVTYWYHFGPQGETREITDGTGAIVKTYTYDAYGQTLSSSGTLTNPFRYGGKFGYYSEGTAGFMLAGARWYSHQLKRWISRDPIRYKGGDNLYEYVEQNPVRFVDPEGAVPADVIVAGASTGLGAAAARAIRAIASAATTASAAEAVAVAGVSGLLVCAIDPYSCEQLLYHCGLIDDPVGISTPILQNQENTKPKGETRQECGKRAARRLEQCGKMMDMRDRMRCWEEVQAILKNCPVT